MLRGAPVLLVFLAARAAAAPDVTLVVTGRRPGLVRSLDAINSPTLLLDRYAGTRVEVTVVRAGPGVYAHRDRYLLAPDGVLGSRAFSDAVASLEPRPSESRPVTVLRSSYTLIVQPERGAGRDLVDEMWTQNAQTGTLPELERLAARVTPVGSTAGPLTLVEVGAEPDSTPLPVDPAEWERRDVLVSRVADARGEDFLFLVKRPLGDPARMLAVARTQAEQAAAAGAGVLLLDPGMAWPVFLSVEGEEDVTRRRGRAGFAAVLPSVADVLGGAPGLAERRAKYRLPFVAANLDVEGDERTVRRSVLRHAGGARIGVVGVVSDRLLLELPHGGREGLRVTEPIAAAQRAIDLLRTGASPPNAIVVLANLDPPGIAALQAHLVGADVIVGDFSRPGLVAPTRSLDFTGSPPDRERAFLHTAALTVRASPAEVTRVDLTFGPGQRNRQSLRSVQVRSIPVTDRDAPDPVLRHWVARRQLWASASYAQPLLPDLETVAADAPAVAPTLRSLPDLYPTLSGKTRDGYPLRFTDSLFGRLATNVTRAALGAEVAVLRSIVRAGDAAGVVTEGEVARWLESEPDRVVLARLSGKELLALRRAVASLDVVWSGLVVPAEATDPLVAGRAVEASAPYRVALADSLLGETAVAEALGEAPTLDRFVASGPGRWEAAADGARLPLRRLVPEALASLPLVADPSRLVPLLVEQGADPEPGLRLRAQNLEVWGGVRNAGTSLSQEAREAVADTRATAATAEALGIGGELALDWDRSRLTWGVSSRFSYDAQLVQGEAVDLCEAALKDDWVVATEGRMPRLLGGGAYPFSSVSYDTQLTQLFGCSSVEQRQAFLALGVGRDPGPMLQELRVAAAVRWDLEAEDAGERLRPGAQAGMRLAAVPADPFVGTAAAGVDWFPSSGGTALELDARFAAGLDLPIGGGLAFRVGYDLFGYVAGHREHRGHRHSVTFGLRYDRFLKPLLGLY